MKRLLFMVANDVSKQINMFTAHCSSARQDPKIR